MRLIASLTSPFARKVRIVLYEKRIECPMTVDIPWNAGTEVPRYNPLGKVPVLVLDDGQTLFDSRVIVNYLDCISPVTQLIPRDGREMVRVQRWEALADGVSEAAAAVFLETRRPRSQQSPDWINRQRQKIDLGLVAMSEDLHDNPWCHGKAYSLADIAVGCSLGYLDFRFGELPWRERHPNLARHAEKLALRPAFAETIPVSPPA